jgi:hypothetical protein
VGAARSNAAQRPLVDPAACRPRPPQHPLRPERARDRAVLRLQGQGETLDDWRHRVTTDLEWGEEQLRSHVPGYKPLAFAPPFGAYGQLDTNDPLIPKLMANELQRRFGLVFVQQNPHSAEPGETPTTRLQLDRTITGGALHSWLEAS